MDVHAMWDKVGALKLAFIDAPAVKTALQGALAGSPKVYLAIVSSDSSISYYFVDQRSLSLDELPRKAL